MQYAKIISDNKTGRVGQTGKVVKHYKSGVVVRFKDGKELHFLRNEVEIFESV